MNNHEQRIKQQRVVYYTIFVLFVFVSLWRATLGVHGDELHTLALGNMIASGSKMFEECWFYLQLSAVFNAPVIFFYKMIFGDLDGIIFFVRVITIVIQAGITFFFYRTFRDEFKEKYVMFASVLFLVYTADFPSLMYKQEFILFTMLLIIFIYRYYKYQNKINLLNIGIVLSGTVLVFPTSILYLLVLVYLFIKIQKNWNKNKEKNQIVKKALTDFGVVLITCLVCGCIFMSYILIKVGITNFLTFFPVVFKDENLDAGFIHKLIHPFIKTFLIGFLSISPFILLYCLKKKISKHFDDICIAVAGLLLLLSFVGQVFVERTGITWHVINYPYEVAFFETFVLYKFLKKGKRELDVRLQVCITIFISITLFTVLIFSVASNQGNITCMYGMIFGAMLFCLILGDAKFAERYFSKSIILVVLATIVGYSWLIPVYETEATNGLNHGQRNIFTERQRVEYGPAKGMLLGEDIYEDYINIYSIIENYVSKDDLVLILGDHRGATSLGYLMSKGRFATYSPQGGWNIGFNGRLTDFYRYNPEKIPSVVIINKNYIKDISEWLKTIDGKYIYSLDLKMIAESKDYLVLK